MTSALPQSKDIFSTRRRVSKSASKQHALTNLLPTVVAIQMPAKTRYQLYLVSIANVECTPTQALGSPEGAKP
jgi:hypothetical protein